MESNCHVGVGAKDTATTTTYLRSLKKRSKSLDGEGLSQAAIIFLFYSTPSLSVSELHLRTAEMSERKREKGIERHLLAPIASR